MISNEKWEENVMEWTGKTILITGASSGIGLETARAFLEGGALVYINGRNMEQLERAAAELNHLPGIAVSLPGDVSIVSECERMLRQVSDNTSGLDVL
jgi:NAD(P)-dependent dehydrogenase (short-subunit alcohol dehydrogenase family)